MKKIASIILLVVIAYNLIGLVVVFKALQTRMKDEFLLSLKSDLNNRALTVICYSAETKAGFSMLEERELCYNGKMYDIVREEKHNGNRVFYCVSDDAETALIVGMEASVAKSMNQYGHNGNAQVFILLWSFYMLPDPRAEFFMPDIKNHFACNFQQPKESPFIGLHFPPPKVS